MRINRDPTSLDTSIGGPAPKTRCAGPSTRSARTPRSVAEGDVLSLAVILKDSGELVGDFILCWTSEEHQQAEIGYIIHPDHAGHGYATEAGRVLLRIAFQDLGLHRVVASTDARNTASGRVLEKLGMRAEAHFVENEYVKGEWQSERVYAILAREWQEAT